MAYNATERILPGDYVVFTYPMDDPRDDSQTHLGLVVEEDGVLYAESLTSNLFGAEFHLVIGEEAIVHGRATQAYIDQERRKAWQTENT